MFIHLSSSAASIVLTPVSAAVYGLQYMGASVFPERRFRCYYLHPFLQLCSFLRHGPCIGCCIHGLQYMGASMFPERRFR
jgi:hypothetical protein